MMAGNGNGMGLGDLLPESWINNRYMSTITRPKIEDTFNDRDSNYGSSYKAKSIGS